MVSASRKPAAANSDVFSLNGNGCILRETNPRGQQSVAQWECVSNGNPDCVLGFDGEGAQARRRCATGVHLQTRSSNEEAN
jgi:hypothetical protein